MKQRKIRCVKCVLVDGYAGATFEEVPGQGSVCILCRDFRRRAFLGKEQFLRDLGLYENPAYYHPENLLRIIKDNDLCHETAFHARQGAGGGGVKYLHFFDYFENNPFEIRKLVESELGCRLPAGDDWHFDCHVETFKHLLYYAMLGYTETDFHLAQMVRYGVMAREQAVEALLVKRKQIAGGAAEVFALARELGCDEKTVGDLGAFVDQSEYLGSRRRTGARIAGYIGPARRLRKAS